MKTFRFLYLGLPLKFSPRYLFKTHYLTHITTDPIEKINSVMSITAPSHIYKEMLVKGVEHTCRL